MTLKSYNIPAKQRVRKRFRKFLKQTILKRKKPKDVYVLCLPSWEALEIYQVYDKLGIPRCNILGVEEDKEAFEILRRKRLGIDLFYGDILERVFKSPSPTGQFDIISLDLSGHLTDKVIRWITAMFDRHRLSSGGVFSVTHFASREHGAVKELFTLFNITTEECEGVPIELTWYERLAVDQILLTIAFGVHDEQIQRKMRELQENTDSDKELLDLLLSQGRMTWTKGERLLYYSSGHPVRVSYHQFITIEEYLRAERSLLGKPAKDELDSAIKELRFLTKFIKTFSVLRFPYSVTKYDRYLPPLITIENPKPNKIGLRRLKAEVIQAIKKGLI